MEQKALGLVETLGLVPAIEGADAAVKSADVELTGLKMIGAGLVTIVIVGDISAVSSAVDAGKAAATRLGTVRSTTVIGRTGEGLETVIGPNPDPEKTETAPVTTTDETVVGKPPETEAEAVTAPLLETEAKTDIGTPSKKKAAVKKVDLAALRNMSVVKLRQFARKLPGLSLAQKKIKYARKKELIEAIVEHHRDEEK